MSHTRTIVATILYVASHSFCIELTCPVLDLGKANEHERCMTCFSVDLLTGRGNKYILYSNLLTPDGITIQADQMPNGLPTL
jgi:hypothetical protein